jgi:hypothetical protein
MTVRPEVVTTVLIWPHGAYSFYGPAAYRLYLLNLQLTDRDERCCCNQGDSNQTSLQSS